MILDLSGPVTYEFQNLNYDTCTETRILAIEELEILDFDSFTV